MVSKKETVSNLSADRFQFLQRSDESQSDDKHLRADIRQREQFSDVLVVEPDTAIRRPTPDLTRVVRSVNAVIRPAQIQRVCAKWVIRAGADEIGPLRIALLHCGRRAPGRAFHFLRDTSPSTPGQILRQGNAGRLKLVGRPVGTPVVQSPGRKIDKNGTPAGTVEIGLPIESAEA